MKHHGTKAAICAGVIAALVLPIALPAFQIQLAYLWVMVLFALTWDTLGGQMGYSSFGNIVFYGLGMYTAAVVQRGLYFTMDEYASLGGRLDTALSPVDYLTGLGLGMVAGALLALVVAAVLGMGILGVRGHYFAICTLGVGVAAGEIASGWDYVGAGSGLMTPLFPESLGNRGLFFYYLFLFLAAATLLTLRWLYRGRFGLAINAIRDDEDKAEALGLHTTRYKTVAWCISALFLALAGAGVGHMEVSIDPIDTAFKRDAAVWMVLMATLGGRGTLWGPVVGAFIFHVTKEFFWSQHFLFGWQWVALGLLLVIVVVFFPAGIAGWLRVRWPERFGETVDQESRTELGSLEQRA